MGEDDFIYEIGWDVELAEGVGCEWGRVDHYALLVDPEDEARRAAHAVEAVAVAEDCEAEVWWREGFLFFY